MVHGDIVPDNVLLLAPFQTSLRVEPWQELKLQVWRKCGLATTRISICTLHAGKGASLYLTLRLCACRLLLVAHRLKENH